MIGVAIKTEIKSEVKIELDRVNTRHKYKRHSFPDNPNYIHPDGTPCRSARRKAAELPDLPPIDDTQYQHSTNGLPVETTTLAPSGPDNSVENTKANNTETDINNGLLAETTALDGQVEPTAVKKNSVNGLPAGTTSTYTDIPKTCTETNKETREKHGLHGETSQQNTESSLETSENNIENRHIHEANGLHVETHSNQENNNELTVETSKQATPSSQAQPTRSELNTNSVKSDDDKAVSEKESEDSTVSEAALGLMMLHKGETSGHDKLLEKYDNSSLLPVDAAHRVDCCAENLDNNNNDSNTNYDSDDTIILQKEIEDTIGKPTTKSRTMTPQEARAESALPVETNNNDTNNMVDTTRLTTELSKLTVNQPMNSDTTPVSPNKGTVVFRSYKLCRRAAEVDKQKAIEAQSHTQTSCYAEDEVQLISVPSGNSTRPPSPNKYKIRKFQIDNVRYYSCLSCNKHFDSIQRLNNHHKHNHLLVSCDVCNKIYDTANSLFRHSYTHLSGQYQCSKCPQSFHFKSELESHSNKHSERKFLFKKCDRGFVCSSDLNAHLDTHGQKWKCSYKGCNKECSDKRYLNTHMKVHSNELKYPCRKCKKRFHFYEQCK